MISIKKQRNQMQQQLLSDRMISDFAGHKDISTTQKYYIHSVTPLTDKADVFAKVFKPKAV